MKGIRVSFIFAAFFAVSTVAVAEVENEWLDPYAVEANHNAANKDDVKMCDRADKKSKTHHSASTDSSVQALHKMWEEGAEQGNS